LHDWQKARFVYMHKIQKRKFQSFSCHGPNRWHLMLYCFKVCTGLMNSA
jgi:hypothetical protein